MRRTKPQFRRIPPDPASPNHVTSNSDAPEIKPDMTITSKTIVPVVIPPTETLIHPTPASPTPTAIQPTPTLALPTPTVAPPTPTAIKPTPTVATPTPTVAPPTPTAIKPTPTIALPTPTAAPAAPTPTPEIVTAGGAEFCADNGGFNYVQGSCNDSRIYPPASCGTSLKDKIAQAPAGSVLDLTGCVYSESGFTINKAITVIGPTISFPINNPWGDGLWLGASDITIDQWTFESAGTALAFAGVSNIQVKSNVFRGYSGNPIFMWGAVNNILIEDNTITNTRNIQSDIIGGRGSEGSNPCPIIGRNVTIRNNVADQGSNGWFGIELKCFEDVVIEGNILKGGAVLISLPDSNHVTIRDNT